MTKSAMIRARMDPALKEEVEEILQSLGLSTTQALTLFYQQIRLTKGIPFELRLPGRLPERKPADIVERSDTPFPVNTNRSIMDQNMTSYQEMHSELVKDYLDQYVAICDDQLIDYDADPIALLQRVRTQHPNKVVLRRKVELAPERELRIRHPRIEKLP